MRAPSLPRRSRPITPAAARVVPVVREAAGRWQRVHLGAALLACVALPVASYAGALPPLAWSMYSGGAEYRLLIIALADGGAEPIAPTRLAAYVGADDLPFFAGADHFR